MPASKCGACDIEAIVLDAIKNPLKPQISSDDRIRGNKDAPIVVVEYSDFECPFCSQLHPTLARVVEESEGEVAWVYRHLPLTAIHSRAQVAAVASECVAELGGNDAFWSYSDALFGNYRGLTSDFLQTSAVAIGIDSGTFDACLTSGKHDARVQADLQNANASGGTGTPFSIVINGKGEPFPFAGALPYEQIKAIVGAALASS